jgi:hypothetical protein
VAVLALLLAGSLAWAQGESPLVVQAVKIEGTVGPGKTVTVVYDIANTGPDATGARDDGVFISTDAMITPDDIPLQFVRQDGLAAGQKVQLRVPVSLPANLAAGDYFVGVVPDLASEVSSGSPFSDVSAAITFTGPPKPPASSSRIPDGLFLITRADGKYVGTITGNTENGHVYFYVSGGKITRMQSNASGDMTASATASTAAVSIKSDGKFTLTMAAGSMGSLNVTAKSGATKVLLAGSAQRTGFSADCTISGQFGSRNSAAGTYRWRLSDAKSGISANIGNGTWEAQRVSKQLP